MRTLFPASSFPISWRRVLLLTLLCLLSLGLHPRSVRGQPAAILEYELKAIYLYKFLDFVHWPPQETGLEASETLVIGIVGTSPFDDALEKIQVEVQETGKRNISVRYFGPYREGMDLSRCHLLFVSFSEEKNFARIIGSLEEAPVLTVADTDGFLAAGGMIAFLTRDDRIRWSINRTPVQDAGLRLSSRLLQIAVSVLAMPAVPEER